MNADGEAISRDDRPMITFADTTINLDRQHKMSQGCVKVNVKDCMEFVTAKADMNKVLQDQFIVKHKELILELASAEEVVRLFDKLNDGKIEFIEIILQSSIISTSLFLCDIIRR